jgi:hypothetical protein
MTSTLRSSRMRTPARRNTGGLRLGSGVGVGAGLAGSGVVVVGAVARLMWAFTVAAAEAALVAASISATRWRASPGFGDVFATVCPCGVAWSNVAPGRAASTIARATARRRSESVSSRGASIVFSKLACASMAM